MSLCRLPLSYCTNVHPGMTLEAVEGGLDRYTVAIQKKFGHDLAAGLWLAQPVVEELLATPRSLPAFAGRMVRRGLTVHTLNAFPYGNFHGIRVKEQVYLPDWSQARRRTYTENCANVLAQLLPDDRDGSISTLPLGFKRLPHRPNFLKTAVENLIQCARHLAHLRETTGKMIRLAMEPEPLCELETTDETIEFFRQLRQRAAEANALAPVQEHIGVCFDVCHQAVEFEDVAESIRLLDGAQIRINKIHISCAIEIDHPAENEPARQALRRYIEPRYLHQTLARTIDGRIVREVDLTEQLLTNPPADFASANAWRVHFHVPVNAEQLGPLKTTRPALRSSLAAVANLPYAAHLEVETYTWEVLPDSDKPDLTEGIAAELHATTKLIKLGLEPAGVNS
jgi:hypothetical protein